MFLLKKQNNLPICFQINNQMPYGIKSSLAGTFSAGEYGTEMIDGFYLIFNWPAFKVNCKDT